MVRFEEVQMRIAESAKNYLEIFNMQVFTEQFTLDRESRFSMTLPNMESPFVISATVSYAYDAFQTAVTVYEEPADETDADVDTSLDLEFIIKFPIMDGYPAIDELLEEIKEEFPDTEPILTAKEVLFSDDDSKEFEISYFYNIESDEALDSELFDEIFEELKNIMELIYNRTKEYIDMSWYREEEE